MTPPAAVDEVVPQEARTARTATRPAEPTSRTTVESLAPTATATCGPRRLRHHLALVASTGQRPDLALTRELRLDLDPWREIRPLIDSELAAGTLVACGPAVACRTSYHLVALPASFRRPEVQAFKNWILSETAGLG